MKEGLAGSIFSIWMCNKFIVVFSMNIFHCWPIDFRWAILSCRCVDNVETKCLQLPHPPSLLRERGPPPPYICVHVRVHAHMNVHGFGFTLKCMHQCVCVMHVCVCAHTCVRVHVLEGEPALLAFTSTAIEHLCLALLLVATVTKAQEWSGCSSWREGERQREKTERERFFFFACRLNHNNRFNATHQKTRFRYGDEWNVNATERCAWIWLVQFLSHTCIHTHV